MYLFSLKLRRVGFNSLVHPYQPKFCTQDQHSHHLSSSLTASTTPPCPGLPQVLCSSHLTGITILMLSLLLHSHSASNLLEPVEDSGMLRASSTEQFMHLFTLKTISIPNSSEGNLNFLFTSSTSRFYQLSNLASTQRQNLGRTNLVLFLFFLWNGSHISSSLTSEELDVKMSFKTAMLYPEMWLHLQF